MSNNVKIQLSNGSLRVSMAGSGEEIKNLVGLTLDPITPAGPICARLDLVGFDLDIEAIPFLSDQTLAEVAARHGYELSPIGELTALRTKLAEYQISDQSRPMTLKGHPYANNQEPDF